MKNREDGRVRLVTQRSGDYVITSGQGQPVPVFVPWADNHTDRINTIRERLTMALAQLSAGGRQVQLVLAQEWEREGSDSVMYHVSELLTVINRPGQRFWTPPELRTKSVITIALDTEETREKPNRSFETLMFQAMEEHGKDLDLGGLASLGKILVEMPVQDMYQQLIDSWTRICHKYVGNNRPGCDRNPFWSTCESVLKSLQSKRKSVEGPKTNRA